MEYIKDKKVLELATSQEAFDVVERIGATKSSYIFNTDKTKYYVFVDMRERHKLTQEERDAMIDLPTEFKTK